MKTIITICICILLSSCQIAQKTPEEAYQEKMKTATDEELMSEIIGKPLIYEVINFEYLAIRNEKLDYGGGLHSPPSIKVINAQYGAPIIQSKDKVDYSAYNLGINQGASLQVIFTKGSVYIEKFGRLIGSYEEGKYANAEGTIKLKFGDEPDRPFSIANLKTADPLDGGRNNPVKDCEKIGIVLKHTIDDGFKKKDIYIHYYLKSLTKPGYFKKPIGN